MGGSVSNKGKKRPGGRLGHYWANGEAFLALPVGMRESAAWRVLTAKEQWILTDWIECYNRASNNDRMDILDIGFAYSWGHCRIDVSERTFRSARRSIARRGWFRCPPQIQSLRPGSPSRFIPSQDWERYEPTALELQTRQRREKAKAGRIRRAKLRKSQYLSETERGCKKVRDTGCKKVRDTREPKAPTPCKKVRDMCPKNDANPVQKGCGSKRSPYGQHWESHMRHLYSKPKSLIW